MSDPIENLLDAISTKLCAGCRHPEEEHRITPATAINKYRLCLHPIGQDIDYDGMSYCSCMDFREQLTPGQTR